jgi:hypothetical protein
MDVDVLRTQAQAGDGSSAVRYFSQTKQRGHATG